MQRGGQRTGGRLGDLRVRLGRRRSRVVEVRLRASARRRQPTILFLPMLFAGLIAIGTLLLLMPFATRGSDGAGLLTALFTATSAACVTGLVVVDTHDFWSPFGQAVIFGLFQLGGLGIMTSSTLLLLLLPGRLSLGRRMVVREAHLRGSLAGETLGRLGAGDLARLVRRIIVATLAVEAVGAALLVVLFSIDGGGLAGRNVWRGVFTAVSAFTNAGFDLEGGFRSLTELHGNPLLLGTVAVLVVFGSTGYAIWSDVWTHRRWRPLSLDTKIVVLATVALTLLGAAALAAVEMRDGGAFDGLAPWTVGVRALIESIYARTAGFTLFDIGLLRGELLLLLAGLMFIGGASGSTAGGIKLTTFSVLGFAIIASVRGHEHVTVFGREIPWVQINQALSVALLSVALVFGLVFALALGTAAAFEDVMFEAVSAFTTNGLTAGITRELNDASRLFTIVGMYIGRLGPLTIALALAGRMRERGTFRYPEEPVSIG